MDITRFLPRITRTALEEELEAHGILKLSQIKSAEKMDRAITCKCRVPFFTGVMCCTGLDVSLCS